MPAYSMPSFIFVRGFSRHILSPNSTVKKAFETVILEGPWEIDTFISFTLAPAMEAFCGAPAKCTG